MSLSECNNEVLSDDFGDNILTNYVVEPYLHVEESCIYNPLTDKTLDATSSFYVQFLRIVIGENQINSLSSDAAHSLIADRWLVRDEEDFDRRFYLKYAVIEGTSGCNQSCYFCPVAFERREEKAMSLELYDSIAVQLAQFKHVMEGVFMLHYNEPTIDPLFVERVKILLKHGLKPAVNSNGTGLTAKRVDELMSLGGLRYLSINLSTIKREKYIRDRGADHLDIVLKNLQYMKNKPLAKQMNVAVIGEGDDAHKEDFEAISHLFKNSHFEVLYFESMDRAGLLSTGRKPKTKVERLRGCLDVGSRPLQFVNVDYRGICVLCCQDYYAKYELGDLRKQSLLDVLTSEAFAQVRRWAYGREEAPRDFLCRNCVFART